MLSPLSPLTQTKKPPTRDVGAPDSHRVSWDRWETVLRASSYRNEQMWIDCRFEAGKTWEVEELAIAKSQYRHLGNYNFIRPGLDLICGTELANRREIRMYGQTSKTNQEAQSLTALWKFAKQQNANGKPFLDAFRWMIKAGAGYTRTGFSPDPRAYLHEIATISPFDCYEDPANRAHDMSDSMDFFVANWWWDDYIEMLFPKYSGYPGSGSPLFDPLSHSSDEHNQTGDYPAVMDFNQGAFGSASHGPGHGMRFNASNSSYTQESEVRTIDRFRGQTLVVERWYKVPAVALFARCKNGVVLENTEANHAIIAKKLIDKECTLMRYVTDHKRCCLMTQNEILIDAPSPYSHNRYPFVKWCSHEDENGVAMGVVRSWRDPQKEANARTSHALKETISNVWAFEGDAFVDEAEAIIELRKPNGNVKLLQGGLAKIKRLENMEANQWNNELRKNAIDYIRDMSGPTQELYGSQTNAVSGVAISSRQNQGNTAMGCIFNARDMAHQQICELTMANMQDTMDQEEEIRITGDSQVPVFITLNQKDPTTGEILNNITQGKFDVVMVEEAENATENLAKSQQLSAYLQSVGDPALKEMFAPEMASMAGVDDTFVEKIQSYLQSKQSAPPKPEPAVLTEIYKDGPEDVRRQIEQEQGLQPSKVPTNTPGNPRTIHKESSTTSGISQADGSPIGQPQQLRIPYLVNQGTMQPQQPTPQGQPRQVSTTGP